MIERAFGGWKLKMLAFALAWWLAALPEFCHWAWRVFTGMNLPQRAANALQFAYALLFAGFLVALIYSESNTCGASDRSRKFAQWFIFGAGSIPLAFLLWRILRP
jgi:hypothetical protein